METSLPKSNIGTHGLRNEFCTLSGWDRQFGRFRLSPKILEVLGYFMKNMGQNFFKDGTLQEILGYVGSRLADWSLNSGLHGL